MKTQPTQRARWALKVAEAFKKEDPTEYEGETVQEIADSLLKNCSDEFLKFTHEVCYPGVIVS
jgi:hypothetical protein